MYEPAALCAHQSVFGAAPAEVTFVGSHDNVDKVESDLDVEARTNGVGWGRGME